MRAAFGLLLVVACLVLPAPARALPSRFFGAQADGIVTDGTLDTGSEFRAMTAAGVGFVRFSLYWSDMQPYARWSQVPDADRSRFEDVGGIPTDFATADTLMADVAAARLRALPVLERTPAWARVRPDFPSSGPTPAGVRAYAKLLGALVRRYGRDGSFWSAHPYFEPAYVRQWQIWNEPDGSWAWHEQPSYGDYGSLLQASYSAVKAADPQAKVIAAGLVLHPWVWLRALYWLGGGRYFDVAAIHPFAPGVGGMSRIIRRTRRVMRRFGDARKPLLISELTWPAGKDITTPQTEIETTDAGQARRLGEAFRLIASHRRSWHIRGVSWSTWATGYSWSTSQFDYTGLFRYEAGRLVAQPSYSAFVSTVAALTAMPRAARR